LLPLQVLVHEFRHRDRAETCRAIPGISQSHGRVVLTVTTSVSYSGGWNQPIAEGTLV
jgi:hypothetical protein